MNIPNCEANKAEKITFQPLLGEVSREEIEGIIAQVKPTPNERRFAAIELKSMRFSEFLQCGEQRGVQFNGILRFAVDIEGNLYAADARNDRICKYTADGTIIANWGSQQPQIGRFWCPRDVAVDADGAVYVADPGHHAIHVLEPNGTFVASLGGKGAEPGLFLEPSGVAVDPNGNIWVADTGNNRIQVVDPDGECRGAWGSPERGQGGFDRPCDIEVGGKDDIYVTDAGNRRMIKVSSSGVFAGALGVDDAGLGQSGFATLAVDVTGVVYVADRDNSRVLRFEPSLTSSCSWSDLRIGLQDRVIPVGIVIDPDGTIYIADRTSQRILMANRSLEGPLVGGNRERNTSF